MPSKKKRTNRSGNEETKTYQMSNANKRRKTNHKKIASDSEHTKKVKAVKGKKMKDKKRKKHPKLMMAIKILIVLFLLLCVIAAGIIAGMFFGLFGDEFEITKDELKIGVSNSIILNQKGEVIANLSGDEKRKIISLGEMAPYLPKAYVAIEDERFYKHNGVDFKRTAGAILNTVLGKSTYGGSTITQQLVKNITKEDEVNGIKGIMRKVKEWAKAYQVERMISKDQILELYLNILYVGKEGNLHGVELGAEYYFNKSAKDLDLAECAFLAGINSSPSYYDPFDENADQEKLNESRKNKTLTVLEKMKELGFIENEEDYNTAVAKAETGLTFTKGTMAGISGNSYHTDAVIEQVVEQVMEEKGISRELARNYVYSSGLKIYSTVDANVQNRLEQEVIKSKYQIKGKERNKDGTLKNDHTQAAMIVIDHKTGYVTGVVGGLGEKTGSTLNRATQGKRQPGSSIKPLADISPALQEKIITAATVYTDEKTDFNGYKPKNDNEHYENTGINIRFIIAESKNVPEVKIMAELTPTRSIDYMRNFGVSSLHKSSEVKAREPHDEHLSLAIGGITDGITPLEMAAGYATIANNGEYIEPTFYTKVEDSNGNVILTPNQVKRRVISEQNAYIVKSILQEPVKSGTATYCAISGMDVGAKTGTTDNSYDRWLCGITPYYAAACWYGYDTQEEVKYSAHANPAGEIWDAVMTDLHKGMPNARFERPDGIVEQSVCSITGGLATTGCPAYKEIFTADNLPEKCQGHGSQTICSESGKIATQYCSEYCETKVNSYGGILPKEQLGLWKPLYGSSSVGRNRVTDTCTIHTKPKTTTNNNNTSNNTNITNSGNNILTSENNFNTGNTNTNTAGNGGSAKPGNNSASSENKLNTNTGNTSGNTAGGSSSNQNNN